MLSWLCKAVRARLKQVEFETISYQSSRILFSITVARLPSRILGQVQIMCSGVTGVDATVRVPTSHRINWAPDLVGDSIDFTVSTLAGSRPLMQEVSAAVFVSSELFDGQHILNLHSTSGNPRKVS